MCFCYHSCCPLGRLVTGDCKKNIHVWEPQEGGTSWTVDQRPFSSHSKSVEDLQWSPTEATVCQFNWAKKSPCPGRCFFYEDHKGWNHKYFIFICGRFLHRVRWISLSESGTPAPRPTPCCPPAKLTRQTSTSSVGTGVSPFFCLVETTASSKSGICGSFRQVHEANCLWSHDGCTRLKVVDVLNRVQLHQCHKS